MGVGSITGLLAPREVWRVESTLFRGGSRGSSHPNPAKGMVGGRRSVFVVGSPGGDSFHMAAEVFRRYGSVGG